MFGVSTTQDRFAVDFLLESDKERPPEQPRERKVRLDPGQSDCPQRAFLSLAESRQHQTIGQHCGQVFGAVYGEVYLTIQKRDYVSIDHNNLLRNL